MATVNIFWSVNRNDAYCNEYFSATVFNCCFAESCAAVRFTELWVLRFWNTIISQGSVATSRRCGGREMVMVMVSVSIWFTFGAVRGKSRVSLFPDTV